MIQLNCLKKEFAELTDAESVSIVGGISVPEAAVGGAFIRPFPFPGHPFPFPGGPIDGPRPHPFPLPTPFPRPPIPSPTFPRPHFPIAF
jgi:hypothetical protein